MKTLTTLSSSRLRLLCLSLILVSLCNDIVQAKETNPSQTPDPVPSPGIAAASSQRRVTPPPSPAPTRRLLVPDDEDPQLGGEGVEWVLPQELKRRIAEQERIMAVERARLKVLAEEEKKRKIDAIEISRRRLMSGSLVKEELIGSGKSNSKELPPIISTATGVDQQALLASVYRVQKLQSEVPDGDLPPILIEIDDWVDEWVIQYNITKNITSNNYTTSSVADINDVNDGTRSKGLQRLLGQGESIDDGIKTNNANTVINSTVNDGNSTITSINKTVISVLESGYNSGNFTNSTHSIYQRRRKRSFDEILELRKKARLELLAAADKYGVPIKSLSVDHFDVSSSSSFIDSQYQAEASVLPNGVSSSSSSADIGLKRALQATKLGPVFPIHPDDASPNEVLLFSTVTANASVPYKEFIGTIKPVAGKGCNEAAAALCPKALSNCFRKDPTSRENACQCFFENGACYKRANCHDLLPKADINMCFNRMFCGSMDICEGNGAGTSFLATSALILSAIAIILVTLEP